MMGLPSSLVLAAAVFAAPVEAPPPPDVDAPFVQMRAALRLPSPLPWSPAAVVQILPAVAPADYQEGASWVLLEGGDLWHVGPGGRASRAWTQQPGAGAGTCRAGSRSSSGGDGDGESIVIACADQVSWLRCGTKSATDSHITTTCRQISTAASTAGPVNAAAVTLDGRLLLGCSSGVWIADAAGRSPRRDAGVTSRGPVSAVATTSRVNSVAAGTAHTLFYTSAPSSAQPVQWKHLGVGGVIDTAITALAYLPVTGTATGGDSRSAIIAIGTGTALHILGPGGVVLRLCGSQGLPQGNITSMHYGATSRSLWIGTTRGVIQLLNPVAVAASVTTEPQWRYYLGERWLAGQEGRVVSLVEVSHSGRRPLGAATGRLAGAALGEPLYSLWVATAAGQLSRVEAVTMTLSDKAAHYQSLVTPRHDRHGFVAAVPLAERGNLSSAVPTDGDNDGSSTAYYMASQIFRYRVTGAPSAKQAAWRHFRSIEFLHNVTRTSANRSGYIARTVVRCGEPHQGPSGGTCRVGGTCHCPPGRCPGCSPPPGACTGCRCPGWQNSSECFAGIEAESDRCCWSWKSDTSTDETDGHYFGLHVAYDLLAETPVEKRRVATLLCDMTAYIVDADFIFIDPLTGNRTTWGYWSPEILNAVGEGASNGVGDHGKPNERGLNSLEILSYLSVAHKVCSEPGLRQPQTGSYADALAMLLRHNYGENILNTHLTNPGFDSEGLAWFDFGNAFYTFYSFAAAAPWANSSSRPVAGVSEASLQRLRTQFHTGLESYYTARSFSAASERNSLFKVIYTAITGKPGLSFQPFWMLQRYPWELIDWKVQNSHRLDVNIRKDWVACCDVNLSEVALAPDEGTGALTIGGNSPFRLDGGDGMNEAWPDWLCAYWMARHHGQLK